MSEHDTKSPTTVSEGGAIQLSAPDGKTHAVGIWNLHVLIVPDGSGWFAQAYEIDYGVQGSSVEDVKKRFENGLSVTIHHNLDIFGTIANLLHANPDWWALKAQTNENEYDYSCVSMHKVAPKAIGRLPFQSIQYEAVRKQAA